MTMSSTIHKWKEVSLEYFYDLCHFLVISVVHERTSTLEIAGNVAPIGDMVDTFFFLSFVVAESLVRNLTPFLP